MKQQLWIVNSSLVSIFFVVLSMLSLLEQKPPIRRPRRTRVTTEKKKEAEPTISLDAIYKNDIFGTFAALPSTAPPVPTPSQKSLITPIPEPQAPPVPTIPEAKKQEFIDPLSITLKGIVMSSDESKNVVMIADETEKELLYHLGDTIKDAQIIKIVRNRVVFLRANGQQEIFYLRKEDNKLKSPEEELWKNTIKKIDELTYEVDPEKFKNDIESLGEFIETLPLIGAAFHAGTPVGLRVGKIGTSDIGGKLGLKSYDIILSINDLPCSEQKNRLAIYDAITAAKLGEKIHVLLKRGKEDIEMTYKLTHLKHDEKFIPAASTPAQPSEGAAGQMETKQSKLQQRDEKRREFRKQHPNEHRKDTMMEIRKRLLNNLRNRMHQNRVR